MKKNCLNFLSFFFLVLFSTLSPLYGQDQLEIDSLQRFIKTAEDDSNKVNALVLLSKYQLYSNLQQSLKHGEEAFKLSRKVAYTKGESGALNALANALEESGEREKAYEYYQQSLAIGKSSEDYWWIANVTNNIGTWYAKGGNYEACLLAFLDALRAWEKLGSKKDIGMQLSNIGALYQLLNEIDKSMDYQKQSLSISLEISDSTGIATSLNNIGLLWLNRAQPDSALVYLSNAFAIAERHKIWNILSNASSNLGGLYEEKAEYKKALDYYKVGENIAKMSESAYAIAINLQNIGQVYIKMEEYNNAEIHLLHSVEKANSIHSFYLLKEGYGLLSTLYNRKKDFESAYRYAMLFSEVKDSLLNEEKVGQMSEMEAKYETEKKELEIAKLNTEKEKDKLQKYAMTGGILLLFLLAGVLFKGYLGKKKNNRQLEEKNKLISQQKEEAVYQRELVEEKNKEILDSITYAKRIQTAILPPQKLVEKYLKESFILYKPKDIVAGDFYWLEVIGNKVFFAAADCTGHGVPGAMVSVMCSNALTKAVKELGISEPGKILDKAAEILEERFAKSEEKVNDGMDVALCQLDLKTKKLEYAGANNPFCLIREGELIEIKADKQPIGKFENRQTFTNHRVELQKDDSIYIFSDGYVDQFGGPKGKKFKYAQLKEFLIASADKQMAEQKEILDKAFEEWKGDLEQVDDVCIIGVRIL